MPNVTRVAEAAEAVCGALHGLDYEFMGESDDRASTWFIRGDKPKQMRVEVQRSRLADYLIINIEWIVLTRPPSKGRQTININVGESTQRQLRDETERAVLKCLNVFKDVLQGVGLADPQAAVKPPTPEEVDSNDA